MREAEFVILNPDVRFSNYPSFGKLQEVEFDRKGLLYLVAYDEDQPYILIIGLRIGRKNPNEKPGDTIRVWSFPGPDPTRHFSSGIEPDLKRRMIARVRRDISEKGWRAIDRCEFYE